MPKKGRVINDISLATESDSRSSLKIYENRTKICEEEEENSSLPNTSETVDDPRGLVHLKQCGRQVSEDIYEGKRKLVFLSYLKISSL